MEKNRKQKFFDKIKEKYRQPVTITRIRLEYDTIENGKIVSKEMDKIIEPVILLNDVELMIHTEMLGAGGAINVIEIRGRLRTDTFIRLFQQI